MGRESKSRDLMPKLQSDAEGSYWLAQNGLRYYSDELGVTWQGRPDHGAAGEPKWWQEVGAVLDKYEADIPTDTATKAKIIHALDSFCRNQARQLVNESTHARKRSDGKKFLESLKDGGIQLPLSIEQHVINRYLMTAKSGHPPITNILEDPEQWHILAPHVVTLLDDLPKRGVADPAFEEIVFLLCDILNAAGFTATHNPYEKTRYDHIPRSAAGRLIVELIETVLPANRNVAGRVCRYLRQWIRSA